MELQIKFATRTAGSFGTSPAGLVMEWITKTWLRFTCCLLSAVIVLIALSSGAPASEKLTLIVLAPVMSIVYWYMLLFMLLLCQYLGLVGRVLAHVLVIYFFLFSRLVVQQSPKVELPLTKN